MHLVVLDMDEGLAGAVSLVLSSTIMMMPAAAWLYLYMVKRSTGILWSLCYTSFITVGVLMIFNYMLSQYLGAIPFTGLFDPGLLFLSFGEASGSFLMMCGLAIWKFVNANPKNE